MKDALEATGYYELRDYLRKTIEAYLSGKDVFVSAPTGAGKSLTFELWLHTLSIVYLARLLCHRVGDCSVDVSHERSGLKPKFPRNESIVRRRRLLGRTAIGYFKSDRENSIWESRGDPQQLPTHFLSPKTKSPKITK